MFGAPAGISHAIGDQNTIAQTTKLFGEIAMQPAEALLKNEQARYFSSRAGLQEIQIRNQQAWAKRMQELSQAGGAAPGGPQPSPAAQLSQAARNWTEYANFTMDPKALVAASSATRAAAQSAENDARTANLQTTAHVQALDRALGVLQSEATPEQKLAALHQAIQPDNPEEAAWLQDMVRTPEGIEALGRMVMTQRQRLSADVAQQNADRMEETAATQRRLNEITMELRRAQIKDTNSRRERREKDTGKPLVTVSTAERDTAAIELQRRFPGFRDKDPTTQEGLHVLAGEVATDYKNLLRQGVPTKAAMERAIAAHRDEMISFTEQTGGFFGIGGSKTRKAQQILPLPANPADAQEGQTYRNAAGVVAIRRKGGWEPVQEDSGGGLTQEEQSVLDESDDEED